LEPLDEGVAGWDDLVDAAASVLSGVGWRLVRSAFVLTVDDGGAGADEEDEDDEAAAAAAERGGGGGGDDRRAAADGDDAGDEGEEDVRVLADFAVRGGTYFVCAPVTPVMIIARPPAGGEVVAPAPGGVTPADRLYVAPTDAEMATATAVMERAMDEAEVGG